MDTDQQVMLINTIKEFMDFLGVSGDVVIPEKRQHDMVVVTIASPNDSGVLIGKQGLHLSAVEHLVRLIVNQKAIYAGHESFPPFILDVNNYRAMRTDAVTQLARTTARKVQQNRRAESLHPMNSYERRIVHAELTSFEGVATESVGNEPDRRVIIKPRSDY